MMTIEKLERLVDLSMRIGTSVGATGAVLARMGGQLSAEEATEWECLMKEAGLDPYGNDDPDEDAEDYTPSPDDPIWDESPVDLYGPWWE